MRGKQREAATDIEKLKLIGSAANADGKEQTISLRPGHFLRWILEAGARTRHVFGSGKYRATRIE